MHGEFLAEPRLPDTGLTDDHRDGSLSRERASKDLMELRCFALQPYVEIARKLVEDDPQMAKFCDFLRKTNYYWFTMMFKLLDPGLNYEYNGTQNVNGADYDLVKIAFGEGIGDAQDTYVLYINPETKLVEQFLFTVMDFGIVEPFLMKVEYEEIQGLKLPAKRKYVKANWEGEPQNDEWTAEISTNIKFNNGFDRSMFEKPTT